VRPPNIRKIMSPKENNIRKRFPISETFALTLVKTLMGTNQFKSNREY